jgi:hypothetical protein
LRSSQINLVKDNDVVLPAALRRSRALTRLFCVRGQGVDMVDADP